MPTDTTTFLLRFLASTRQKTRNRLNDQLSGERHKPSLKITSS
jgi:hypothetical protein